MRDMNRNVLTVAAGIVIVAFGAAPSRAQTPVVHTVDLTIAADPAGNTSDGADPPNAGQSWSSGPHAIDPITLNFGDTITGTVTFSNIAALEVADDGGGFFTIPDSFTGFERFLVRMTGEGNNLETRQHSSSIEFLGVTGTPITNPITHEGFFSSADGSVEFVENMVDAGNSFTFTGFKYSYTLVSSLADVPKPLRIESISFRIQAERIDLLAEPPRPFPESTLTGAALDSACTQSTTDANGTPPYIVGVTIGRPDLGPVDGQGPEIATCDPVLFPNAPQAELCGRSATDPNPCYDPTTLPDVTRTLREKVAVVRRSPGSTVHCFDIEGVVVCVNFSF